VQPVEDFLAAVERRRAAASASLDPRARSSLGQFFTPRASAELIASMAPPPADGAWRLIDAGAGVGSLTAALVARWLTSTEMPSMSVLAYEVDAVLRGPLEATLAEARAVARTFGRELQTAVRTENFVLRPPPSGAGNIVLMNPPYRKLGVGSDERAAFAGEERAVRVTNMYAAFLVRAVRALAAGGGLVAITPRSFTNGPYFKDLRSELLRHASFLGIHVFESRDRVFSDADVLQENVIFSMRLGAPECDVAITTSRDAADEVVTVTRGHDQIVDPGDPHRFIRLPLGEDGLSIAERMVAMSCTLTEIGCEVSTGRVVDFRVKEQLRDRPSADTAPLLYAQNIRDGRVVWPAQTRKPQALLLDDATRKLLLANEHYVVVKRFSSKEEPRRVVAALAEPQALAGAGRVGFENHLNVFHASNRGLDPKLAAGLAAYLNSRFVDDYVRQFNGHTQINATDLRELRYPSLTQLHALGEAAIELEDPVDADALDALLETVLARASEDPLPVGA
jgi:adenine-specific DNA-methyltransferase